MLLASIGNIVKSVHNPLVTSFCVWNIQVKKKISYVGSFKYKLGLSSFLFYLGFSIKRFHCTLPTFGSVKFYYYYLLKIKFIKSENMEEGPFLKSLWLLSDFWLTASSISLVFSLSISMEKQH